MTRRQVIAVSVGLLILVVLASWQTIIFGVAVLMAERAPAPLDGPVGWGKPHPAFSARFAPGTSEQALLLWLRTNRFEISTGHAERVIQSLPCNERAEILWTSDSAGKLTKASGTMYDAGCL